MLSFKKAGIFSRGSGQEDACEQEDQSGGVLAVWGSPGSGKTTVAVRLAKYLADKRRNVILLLCDMTAPMLPCICPAADLECERSLGSVLAAAHVSENLVKNNLVTHKRLGYLTMLGMLKGENEYTYPPYNEVQARELIDCLREIAPYGDIYGRLDDILGLTYRGGYHTQYTEDGGMGFRVWGLDVEIRNAPFASGDSAGDRFVADCEIELEVPVSFGGELLPPMRMTVKVSAGYAPRF